MRYVGLQRRQINCCCNSSARPCRPRKNRPCIAFNGARSLWTPIFSAAITLPSRFSQRDRERAEADLDLLIGQREAGFAHVEDDLA